MKIDSILNFKDVLRCKNCGDIIFRIEEIDKKGKCKKCHKLDSSKKAQMIKKMLEQAKKIINIDLKNKI